MKLFKADPSKRYIVTEENAPGHVDPENVGKVWRQAMTDNDSELRCGPSGFDGVPSAMHKHAMDQIVIITEGICECTNDKGEKFDAYPGDVVLFEAGEMHTHGAKPGQKMVHYGITYRPKDK